MFQRVQLDQEPRVERWRSASGSVTASEAMRVAPGGATARPEWGHLSPFPFARLRLWAARHGSYLTLPRSRECGDSFEAKGRLSRKRSGRPAPALFRGFGLKPPRFQVACLTTPQNGGGGIRTLVRGKPPETVFETAAFNRSATPPGGTDQG